MKNIKIVITKKLLIINRIYKVIILCMFKRCNYFVVTLLCICNYFVITFSLPGYALELSSLITEACLVYGQADKDEKIFVSTQYLNNGNESNGLYELPQDKQGRFVIGIPQNASKELVLFVETNGKIIKKSYPIDSVVWQEEIVNGLQPEKINPSPEVRERISSESKLLKNKRQLSEYKNFPEKFNVPLERFSRISSSFGARRVLNGVKTVGHSGTDFAAPIGTAIISPADGRVVLVHQNMFYSGKTVMIDHGYGIFSSYSHLKQIDIRENQVVHAGEKIGEVGVTGRTSGPHLHFTVTWFGIRVNPEFILSLK